MVFPGCNYVDGNDVFATAFQWLFSQKSRDEEKKTVTGVQGVCQE